MDILALLDELDDLAERGEKMLGGRIQRWGGNTVVPAARLYEITDKIRAALPEDLKTAEQITHEKDRIIESAHEEKAKILNAARAQAAEMVARETIVREAQKRAEEILGQAQIQADGIRSEASRYAAEALQRLEEYTSRILGAVQKARQSFDEDRAHIEAASQPMPAPPTPAPPAQSEGA